MDIDFQWVFSGTLKGNSAAKPVMELKILGFPKAVFFEEVKRLPFFWGVEGSSLWIVERILLKSLCEFFFGGKMNKRQCIKLGVWKDDIHKYLSSVGGRGRWVVVMPRNVYFSYDDDGPMILKDISCKIGLSSRVGIVGANGAGLIV